MKYSKVIFKRSFLYPLVNALLILGILLLFSACDNNSTTQPDDTSSQPTDTIVPTQATTYFILNLSPIPDLENPGDLAVTFNIQPHRYEDLTNSRLDIEFYWTNIYGSYSEAKRAELVPLNEVLVSGDTTWEGDASLYNTVTLSSQIRLPREGVWKIKATFSTNSEVILTDSIKVAVAEGTSVIMYTEEFDSSPLAYLVNFSYGGVSEKVLDELHPVFIALDISKAPRVGEEAVLTYRIESLYEVTDFSTQFVVYKRTEGVAEKKVPVDNIVTGGALTWTGDLIPGVPIVVTSTIVFPEEGDWKIGVRRDEGKYFDHIWINVTDTRGSFGWEEPEPVTIVPTTTTPVTTIPTTTIIPEIPTHTQTTKDPQHDGNDTM